MGFRPCILRPRRGAPRHDKAHASDFATHLMLLMGALRGGNLLSSGIKKVEINGYLEPAFPHRSLKSIKGMRRRDAYKELVEDIMIGKMALIEVKTPTSDTEFDLDPALGSDRDPGEGSRSRSKWRREVLIAINEGLQEDRGNGTVILFGVKIQNRQRYAREEC